MATRRVVVEGEEVLRKHAKSAGPVTPHLKEILQDMVETMREENGVGLAAPQVGIMRRMFVAQPDPGDDATVYYMIDPVITHYSEEKEWGVEGCLSVPDMVGDVERSVAINSILKASMPESCSMNMTIWTESSIPINAAI